MEGLGKKKIAQKNKESRNDKQKNKETKNRGSVTKSIIKAGKGKCVTMEYCEEQKGR